MILVVGDIADPVIARVTTLLQRQRLEFALLDEATPEGIAIEAAGLPRRRTGWRIRGGGCVGERPVTAVLIRRGPVDAARPTPRLALSARVDAILLATACCVANRPSSATSNYSKPFQLMALAAAGFRVPATMVTSVTDAALQFIARQRGNVVFKGLSSVKTVPQLLQPHHLARLKSVARCPAQFQEQIVGADWRITVIGKVAFASATREAKLVAVDKAEETFPRAFIDRCVQFTRAQGLVISGIDLRLTPQGEVVVFEMNPFPLVTHYEREEDPVISTELCRFLSGPQRTRSDMLA